MQKQTLARLAALCTLAAAASPGYTAPPPPGPPPLPPQVTQPAGDLDGSAEVAKKPVMPTVPTAKA